MSRHVCTTLALVYFLTTACNPTSNTDDGDGSLSSDDTGECEQTDCASDSPSDADADNDTDTDTDADADADTDTDADADADTDSDSDADADGDADADTSSNDSCIFACQDHCVSLGGIVRPGICAIPSQKCCDMDATSGSSDNATDMETDTGSSGEPDTATETDATQNTDSTNDTAPDTVPDTDLETESETDEGADTDDTANAPLFPRPGSSGVCPDPAVRMRFDGVPRLGSRGQLRVFDAAAPATPAAVIDMAVQTITDTIGGKSFTLPRPVYVQDTEVIFVLPASGLGYNRTFFVTLDEGALTGPDGEAVSIQGADTWRFTTVAGPPDNTEYLTVSARGAGDFCTLQRAVDAVSDGGTIALEAGAYFGVTYFTGRNDLTIRGANRQETRIAGINNNNLNPSTRGRALVGVEHITGLVIENLTIENLTPQGGSQAEALTLLDCDRCVVRDADIQSRQDTLLWSGRIFADNCLIAGNVDYIWGTGTAYFNACEIRTVGRNGYIVQSRNSADIYGYVFVDCRLTADPGISGDLLGRVDVSAYPASHIAYINCELGGHIAPEGWQITGGTGTSALRFWEYQSRDSRGSLIDTSRRAAGSEQLTDQAAAAMRDPSTVLGGWRPPDR